MICCNFTLFWLILQGAFPSICPLRFSFFYIIMYTVYANIDTFKNNSSYAIWALSLEFLYAITAILIFIRMIKNKAIELEKEDKQ